MAYVPSLHYNNGIGCLSIDDEESVSIGPGGLVIQAGLVSGPLITGTINTSGFTTTNPNGFQFNSSLGMNNNNISNVSTITVLNNVSVANDPLVTEEVLISKNSILLQDTSTTGYTLNPALKLVNRNTTIGSTNGVPSIETYKNGRNAAAGDVISSQHYYALDAGGQKTEFGRIRTTCISSSVGAEHGSVSIWCARNGGINEVFNFNGATNDNNSLRTLDMNSNNIISAPQVSNIGGTIEILGNQIHLDATTIDFQNTSTTTSADTHNTFIKSASAGLTSTTYLKCKLNGVDIWIPYFTVDPSL